MVTGYWLELYSACFWQRNADLHCIVKESSSPVTPYFSHFNEISVLGSLSQLYLDITRPASLVQPRAWIVLSSSRGLSHTQIIWNKLYPGSFASCALDRVSTFLQATRHSRLIDRSVVSHDLTCLVIPQGAYWCLRNRQTVAKLLEVQEMGGGSGCGCGGELDSSPHSRLSTLGGKPIEPPPPLSSSRRSNNDADEHRHTCAILNCMVAGMATRFAAGITDLTGESCKHCIYQANKFVHTSWPRRWTLLRAPYRVNNDTHSMQVN